MALRKPVKNKPIIRPTTRAIARALLSGVYCSIIGLTSAARKEAIGLTSAARKEDVDGMRSFAASLGMRRVKSTEETRIQQIRCNQIILQKLNGDQLLVAKLEADSTYADLYLIARGLLGLPLRGSSISLALVFNKCFREYCDFKPGEIVMPTYGSKRYCQQAVRGCVFDVVMHP